MIPAWATAQAGLFAFFGGVGVLAQKIFAKIFANPLTNAEKQV
jgi:hypothetical protein